MNLIDIYTVCLAEHETYTPIISMSKSSNHLTLIERVKMVTVSPSWSSCPVKQNDKEEGVVSLIWWLKNFKITAVVESRNLFSENNSVLEDPTMIVFGINKTFIAILVSPARSANLNVNCEKRSTIELIVKDNLMKRLTIFLVCSSVFYHT